MNYCISLFFISISKLINDNLTYLGISIIYQILVYLLFNAELINYRNVIDNYFPTKNDEVKTQNQLSDKTTNHLRHI